MAKRSAEKHADLIFDLGMHRGEDTDFYLAKGFRVIAFEADPDLIESCKERFAEQIESTQLIIVEGAIIADAEEGGTITFYKNPVVTVWGTIDSSWRDRNERAGWESVEITVPTVNLLSCIEKYGVPYYIKIDIEGADMLSLRSLGEFEHKPDYVSIESDKNSLTAIDEELDVLESLGYDSFKPVKQGDNPFTKAPRPAREGLDIDYQCTRDSSGLFGRELSGKWLTRAQVKSAYRRIFFGYAIAGNDTFVRRNRYTRRVWQFIQRKLRWQYPSWYDTHARHSSVR